MKTFIIINGTNVLTAKQKTRQDAITYAQNYCNHNCEVIVREIKEVALSAIKTLQQTSTEFKALKRHDTFCNELTELLSCSTEYASAQYFTHLNTIETNGTGVQMAIRVATILKAVPSFKY